MGVCIVEIIYTLFSSFIESVGPNAVRLVFAFQAAAGEITNGRARALAAVAMGLISVVVGGFAWARGRSTGAGRFGAGAALLLGVIGALVSLMHLAGSTGFGTGGGRAGAIVGLVLSLAGVFFGAAKLWPISLRRQSQSAK